VGNQRLRWILFPNIQKASTLHSVVIGPARHYKWLHRVALKTHPVLLTEAKANRENDSNIEFLIIFAPAPDHGRNLHLSRLSKWRCLQAVLSLQLTLEKFYELPDGNDSDALNFGRESAVFTNVSTTPSRNAILISERTCTETSFSRGTMLPGIADRMQKELVNLTMEVKTGLGERRWNGHCRLHARKILRIPCRPSHHRW